NVHLVNGSMASTFKRHRLQELAKRYCSTANRSRGTREEHILASPNSSPNSSPSQHGRAVRNGTPRAAVCTKDKFFGFGAKSASFTTMYSAAETSVRTAFHYTGEVPIWDSRQGCGWEAALDVLCVCGVDT
ncbi:hypothetical protein LTS18_014750, partial [Coniosporium uncinatum]